MAPQEYTTAKAYLASPKGQWVEAAGYVTGVAAILREWVAEQTARETAQETTREEALVKEELTSETSVDVAAEKQGKNCEEVAQAVAEEPSFVAAAEGAGSVAPSQSSVALFEEEEEEVAVRLPSVVLPKKPSIPLSVAVAVAEEEKAVVNLLPEEVYKSLSAVVREAASDSSPVAAGSAVIVESSAVKGVAAAQTSPEVGESGVAKEIPPELSPPVAVQRERDKEKATNLPVIQSTSKTTGVVIWRAASEPPLRTAGATVRSPGSRETLSLAVVDKGAVSRLPSPKGADRLSSVLTAASKAVRCCFRRFEVAKWPPYVEGPELSRK